MRVLFATSLTGLALVLAACGTSSGDIARPEARPLGLEFIPLSAPPSLTEEANAASFQQRTQATEAGVGEGTRSSALAGDDPAGAITLQQVLALSLVKSPQLAAFSYDTRAAEARTLQAGFRTNPELFMQSEDFGGTRNYSGFQQSQTTLALSQLVEIGAKRSSRLRLARLDESLSAWDYETKRLDVFVEVTKAFVNVLAAQRKLDLASATQKIEEQFYASVGNRVQAGQVSPIEQRRAEVVVANSRITVNKSKHELGIARDRLAQFWGGKANFLRAEGDLNNVTPPPPVASLIAIAAQNPDLARWTTEIQQREARLALERSKEIPDLTINGGVRRYGNGASAFVAGIGVPLPLFGQNRGNILDAQMQVSKSMAQQRAAEARTTAAVQQSFEQLSSSYEEIVTIRRDVLPAAEAAFNGTSIGYRDGKFGLLEVLDTRRAQTDAQARLVDALTTYQVTLAEAERLTGQALRRERSPTRPGERP